MSVVSFVLARRMTSIRLLLFFVGSRRRNENIVPGETVTNNDICGISSYISLFRMQYIVITSVSTFSISLRLSLCHSHYIITIISDLYGPSRCSYTFEHRVGTHTTDRPTPTTNVSSNEAITHGS